VSKRQRGGSTGEAKTRRQACGHVPRAQTRSSWDRHGSGHNSKTKKGKEGKRKK